MGEAGTEAASVLLLIMNFVITLSKYVALDPQSDSD